MNRWMLYPDLGLVEDQDVAGQQCSEGNVLKLMQSHLSQGLISVSIALQLHVPYAQDSP